MQDVEPAGRRQVRRCLTLCCDHGTMMGMAKATSELLRVLGPGTAVAVVAGSMIGSGIFLKPQAVAQAVPHFGLALTAWVVGGILALLGALAVAELSVLFPRAGGNYVYLRETYGPLWGFLWGWVDFWILRTGSIAALATVFARCAIQVVGLESVPVARASGVAAAAIAVLAGVNVLGARWGGFLQNLTTWIKVASLLLLACLPFVSGRADLSLATASMTDQPLPWTGLGAAVLAVLWAYHGWMNLGPLAEEIREPQRYLPPALFTGVGLVMALYLAVNVAYGLTLSQEVLADPGDHQVVAIRFVQEALAPYGGQGIAARLIAAAIMVSVFGALNANILIGPRTYFALGREGLFPQWLGAVHARFYTPARAIVLQAVWAVVLLFRAPLIQDDPRENPFDTLTNYVMFAAIIFETMVVFGVVVLRWRCPQAPRLYRCPACPWIPVGYTLALACVLLNTVYTQPTKSALGLLFIFCGALVYCLTRTRQTSPLQSSGPGA
ncbi:MAG: amino acid permease [Gemmataceae bacterium]